MKKIKNKEKIITVGFSGACGGGTIATLISNTFYTVLIGSIIGIILCGYLEYKSQTINK